MSFEANDGTASYWVVCNDEEQYSIWPMGRAIPPGWHRTERTGPLADCLAYIAEAWTDLRPLSLRRGLAEAPAAEAPIRPSSEAAAPPHLVDRLATLQPVEFAPSLPDRCQALKASIERGFLLIRFPASEGGTELAITLDRQATALNDADFVRGIGTVTLVGDLTLDWRKARCMASLDLATMSGRGRVLPAVG